jgi:ATP-dependent RNA helicase RhlE
MALLPKKRQNLLFSATFSDEIKKLADQLLNKPELIEVARRNAPTELVTHAVYKVSQEQKRALFTHIVRSRNAAQVLVFMRTKHGAARLARQLEKDGLDATAIHGDKSQSQRIEALEGFKDNKVQILVATDVAARGLDIIDLPLVVNYELPHVAEDYIHRIGRTGRAGATGEAISLVSPDEERYLVEIEKLLRLKIEVSTLGDFVPSESRPEMRSSARLPRAAHATATSPRDPGRGPRREPRSRTGRDPRSVALRDAHTEQRHVPHPYADHAADRSRDKSHYDLNPDQPLPRTPSSAPPQPGAALVLPGERSGNRSHAVPALLRKRLQPA